MSLENIFLFQNFMFWCPKKVIDPLTCNFGPYVFDKIQYHEVKNLRS